MTMTHLPGTGPAGGFPAVSSRRPGAGLDGGRIVRALTWARSGDPAQDGRSGPLHPGRPAR
jgi:hypothetical protein